MMVAMHSHQSHPLVLINGRSSLIGGTCSSATTTALLQAHLQRAHWMHSHLMLYPQRLAIHWYWERHRLEVARRVLEQVLRVADGGLVDVGAHSLGADVARLVMEIAPRPVFRRVVLMGPAMSHRHDWRPYKFERMAVFHNPDDRAIFWGGVLPWHPFGFAGRRGFAKEDSRVIHYCLPDRDGVDRWRHSHYFRPDAITELGMLMDLFLTTDVVPEMA